MSTRINATGEYHVTIQEPRFELAEKDGDTTRMCLVLPGVTEDGKSIEAYQYFTRQIVSSGRNKGRPMYEVSADVCHELGMPKPFNPANIEQLNGVAAVFIVEVEEYEGKARARVKFINPVRKPALEPDEAARIWAELTGKAVEPVSVEKPTAATKEKKPTTTLPF